MPTLLEELSRKPGAPEPPAQHGGRRSARRAAGAGGRGPDPAWTRLATSSRCFAIRPIPGSAAYLINWLHLLGVDPQRLAAELEQLDRQSDSVAGPGKPSMDAILLHRETSIRQGADPRAGDVSARDLTPRAARDR